MMLWCLWRRHNDKVWDDDLKPINIAIQLARESLFQQHPNSYIRLSNSFTTTSKL